MPLKTVFISGIPEPFEKEYNVYKVTTRHKNSPIALGDTTFTKPTENKMKTIENNTHSTYLAATFGADR